jgi:hypothetical protein
MKKQLMIILSVAALVLTGCASTTFESTWKAPGVGPETIGGRKIVAIALAGKSARLAAEDAMVNKMKELGSEGMQSYLILDLEASQEQLKQKIHDEGFQVALVMKVLKSEKELSTSYTSYGVGVGGPYPGGFYGYGWGWGAYSVPEVRTDTLFFVETLVYDVAGDKLVWAGRSKTTNPSKIDKFVGEVFDAAVADMKKSGLLASK